MEILERKLSCKKKKKNSKKESDLSLPDHPIAADRPRSEASSREKDSKNWYRQKEPCGTCRGEKVLPNGQDRAAENVMRNRE